MMRVEKLKENHKSYTVTFLDDDLNKTEYVVSEDLVVNHRLIKGKILDGTAFRVFMADYQIDAPMQKTKALLSRYPKTVEETKRYLQDLTDSGEAVEKIIKILIEAKFLDDFEYVKRYFERYFHQDGNGPLKLRFELKQKGIADNILNGFLSHIGDSDIEKNLDKLFHKKLATLRQKPKMKAILSMKQYLYQKGYPIEIAEHYVLKHAYEFAGEDAEASMLEKDYTSIQRRHEKLELTDYDRKSKMIQALMNKGYRYDAIKLYLEGRKNHE
jgi:regulatory protein